jgi:hypothetical protein
VDVANGAFSSIVAEGYFSTSTVLYKVVYIRHARSGINLPTRSLLRVVPIMMRRHLLVILTYFSHDTVAWSSNTGFQEPSLERRAFIANVGSSTTAATLAQLFVGPQSAYAKEPMSTDPATFDTYNIIPDASASLDPKLQKIDVSTSSPKTKI